MAQPVKAYIDPTFLSKIGPFIPLPIAPSLSSLKIATAMVYRDTPESQRIPYISKRVELISPNASRIPTPPMGRLTVLTFPAVYKDRPLPPTSPPPLSNTEWDILWLQKCQLSKDNLPLDLLDVSAEKNCLAELSEDEGHKIPFVIRTGPMGKPDPGLMKRYEAVEIDGDGRAFVMVWIHGRLVAYGSLFAQEGPKNHRRLKIPKGLGNGYDIDIYIAFQGRMTGYEVFYEVIEGGTE